MSRNDNPNLYFKKGNESASEIDKRGNSLEWLG